MSSALRSNARPGDLATRHPAPAAGSAAREAGRLEEAARRGRIAEVLDRGPSIDRAVLALVLLEGLTAREASHAIGISTRRLQSIYQRAIREFERAASGSVPPRRRTSRSVRATLRRAS